MKKFVISLFAALAVCTLAIGVSAREIAPGNNTGGNIVGAAENIVGGVAEGAGNVVGGAVRGVNDVVHGVGDAFRGDNKDGVVRDGNRHVTENERHTGEHNRHMGETTRHAGERTAPVHGNNHLRTEHDRNPSTGIGLGMLEFAAIGTTMLGTAALAGRRRK